MKKLLNGFAIVLFLTPIFASASTITCGSSVVVSPTVEIAVAYPGNPYSDAIALKFTATQDCDVTGASFNGTITGSPGDVTPSIWSDSGGLPNTQLTSGGAWAPTASASCADSSVGAISSYRLTAGTTYWLALYGSATTDISNHYAACGVHAGTGFLATNGGTWVSGGTGRMDFTVYGDSVAPGLTGLSAIINNSTSSVDRVTGFGMDSMGLWMWENLAKPIMGTGLGTLYTVRWYILALIALAIIAFFGFRYAGFFKH